MSVEALAASSTIAGLPKGHGRFATTCWTMVRQSVASHPHSQVAFSDLCRAYWQPVFAYLRRRGTSAENAEDLAQSFFAWLMESDVVARADPQRGRFRTFLVVALRQFAARQAIYDSAAKRRPEQAVLSIDGAGTIQQYIFEPSHEESPERQFDRDWALSVLERAMNRLQEEWAKDGRGQRFAELRPFITGESETSSRDAADRLAMTEGAFRVAVHRLKRRYGELLREEVAITVGNEAEIDQELNDLLHALRA